MTSKQADQIFIRHCKQRGRAMVAVPMAMRARKELAKRGVGSKRDV